MDHKNKMIMLLLSSAPTVERFLDSKKKLYYKLNYIIIYILYISYLISR